MELKKNDFIEIEFTGRITGTEEIFDTNIKADAEKAKLEIKDIKPFILAVGQKMLPEGLDKDLEGKNYPSTSESAEQQEDKTYSIELTPEESFGKRNPQMIKMISTKLFQEQKINPERGMQLNLDGQLVKILSSSGGRTLVDFNNPLAGKNVTYTYKIKRKVTDQKEKINALQDFLFRQRFEFEINEKIIVFKISKEMEQFIKMFASKFEEILGLKIESKVIKPKIEEISEEKVKDNSKEENKE